MAGETQEDGTLEKLGAASGKEALGPSDMKTSHASREVSESQVEEGLSPEETNSSSPLSPSLFPVSFPTLSLSLTLNPHCPGREVRLLQGLSYTEFC